MWQIKYRLMGEHISVFYKNCEQSSEGRHQLRECGRLVGWCKSDCLHRLISLFGFNHPKMPHVDHGSMQLFLDLQ